MKRAFALATLVVLLLPVALAAKDSRDSRDSRNTLVRFEGGIGVDPVSNTGVANVVRGVSPAGQLWTIRDLRAEVTTVGHIRVDGRGLVFAGGNAIGTALAINSTTGAATASISVIATLICETIAPFTQHSTSAVPLAANGDFRIDAVLSNFSPTPSCDTPVLLIRNAAGTQGWFAAGIQNFERDGD